MASSLVFWIEPTSCQFCFGAEGSGESVCSGEGLSKAALHTVVGSYTPSGAAELWIDGVSAASITTASWALHPEKRVFVGGQPLGEQGSGFVGELGLIELNDYPMSTSQIDRSLSGPPPLSNVDL